jgi:anthranilate synthase component 1
MEKIELKVTKRKLLADTVTPVNLYLKLRDVFAGSFLLESSDYHGQENSMSFVCCQPFSTFVLQNNFIQIETEGKKKQTIPAKNIVQQFEEYVQQFSVVDADKTTPSGFFGYTAYNTVRFIEQIPIQQTENGLPEMHYTFFRYVIAFDHFHNALSLYYFSMLTENNAEEKLTNLQNRIMSNALPAYQFNLNQEEKQHISDSDFLEMVETGKKHCFRGDVFQIVLSRRFSTSFTGDEFNVYRALRSVNPSPYLFYFDFGYCKLFGSSPEAQIQVKDDKAFIFPIAGTFKRTGNDQEDVKLAEQLAADAKENAEHIMLVDLARNDLSRHAEQVQVEVFKEVQFYSHVIHLVSKVSGKVKPTDSPLQIAFDTFPAGTLSGAPKHKAMTLINEIEPHTRGFYGGAIGFIGLDRSVNQAIMIRTFLSEGNTLSYQAGAGIVAKSMAENELQEVNNKLGALRKALQLAQTINADVL